MLRMQEMAFPGFTFHIFSGGVCRMCGMSYVGHTRGLRPLLPPSNILSHRNYRRFIPNYTTVAQPLTETHFIGVQQ
jgi:hypothetical protein